MNNFLEKILMFITNFKISYKLPEKIKNDKDYYLGFSDSKDFYTFKPNMIFSKDYDILVNYKIDKNIYNVLRNYDTRITFVSKNGKYHFKIYFKNKDDLDSFLLNDLIEGKL